MVQEAAIKRRVKDWLDSIYPDSIFIAHSDKFLIGIPDLQGILRRKDNNPWRIFFWELKIVRKNKISLRPLQVSNLQKFNSTGIDGGFLLYYEEERRYAYFTPDEIERECYRKQYLPPDIPMWTSAQFKEWLHFALQEAQRKSSLISMRQDQQARYPSSLSTHR